MISGGFYELKKETIKLILLIINKLKMVSGPQLHQLFFLSALGPNSHAYSSYGDLVVVLL